jgi:sulfur carrier protein
VKITVNGESMDVAEESTLLDLFERLELRVEQVAVERNLEVVARREFGACRLQAGDSLEIVTLVGGG